MRSFLIGAAAVALAASPTYADPGKGGGQGAAKSEQGHPGGGGKGDKAQAPKGNSGGGKERGGPDMRAAKPDRGPSMNASGGKVDKSAQKGNIKQAERRVDRDDRPGNPPAVRDDGRDRSVPGYRDDRRDVRVVRDDRRDGTIGFDFGRERGLIDGCPPGLAKKGNGCMPPGLARNRDGDRYGYYNPSWFGYSSLGDGRYFYDDGYLYRMNQGGSVLGYIPLLGGALSIGNPWPGSYQPVRVPDYYVDYYNLGAPGGYRYADDVLYRVDPQSNAITAIAALLTGDRFGVGQPMPAGYDVYNVPYSYRDRYFDTPQADYRYADGYVYQVDPQTQLIQAAIQLLT